MALLGVVIFSSKEYRNIMQALDDLNREVQETKTAVASVATAVADAATRVTTTIAGLKQTIDDLKAQVGNAVDPAVLEAAAASLDAEQTALQNVVTQLNALAPPTPPAPPTA